MRRLLLLLCCLSACSSFPSPAERSLHADQLAQTKHWISARLVTNTLPLVAYYPATSIRDDALTIYIEGDGAAWLSVTQPSSDPTPQEPLGLKLALAQPDGNAAYLARPCQYVDAEKSACPARYWTEERFAPAVIAATSNAIDQLKRHFQASRLTLVGYSGGGAVAALVAARRKDVVRLITLAGNLDHEAWTRLHRITPLSGSLNPADEIEALAKIPQWHFVGGKDGNVTPALIYGFVSKFNVAQRPFVEIEPDFDHAYCWVENWPAIWRDLDKFP